MMLIRQCSATALIKGVFSGELSVGPSSPGLWRMGQKQKSSSDESEELLNILLQYCRSYWSDLSVSNLHWSWTWHLIALVSVTGCQGFIGPFPSAFLDKRCVKNWCKDRTRKQNSKSFFESTGQDSPGGLAGKKKGEPLWKEAHPL